MSKMPERFEGVTAVAKANVYFDGKVASHTLIFSDGSKKTLGLIYPGEYHFNTQAAELMQIIAGRCQVVLDGQSAIASHETGAEFEIPGNSGFKIKVDSGICEYVCSFLS